MRLTKRLGQQNMPTMRGLIMLVLLAAGAAKASDTLNCGDGLVSRGAYRAEVVAQCGDPFWVNEWVESHVIGPDGPVETAEQIRVAEWYLHRGPNRLMRRLTFHNGRLVATETLGYGVSGRPGIGPCTPRELQPGLSMGELVARCGMPAFRESWYGRRSIRLEGLVERHALVRFETWGYDFGRNKFTRYVTFENGRITDVRTGDRGSLH